MNTTDQNKVEQLSKNDLNGIQKAALLLIALNVETASQVFKYLETTDVEAISAEISKVKNIPSHVVEQVIDDYHGGTVDDRNNPKKRVDFMPSRICSGSLALPAVTRRTP